MLPRLPSDDHLPQLYREFLEVLTRSEFVGEIKTDYATRLVTATDNSVYQIVPLAVIFPRHTRDIEVLTRLIAQEQFQKVKLSPRGGGTGTNGQSLCDGIIVDLSRHFADILETNFEEGWVRVQPGVVLDQLNASLKERGVFFAPNLSPSSRATIGGMINTDAGGKGSRIYGKTSDHVLELHGVMPDGATFHTRSLNSKELATESGREDSVGRAYREVIAVVERSGEKFRTELPQLKRFLTGYDLTHLYDKEGHFNLSRVLTGSEGTLAFITEAKVRLTPIAKSRKLFAIRYAEFNDALQAAQVLVASSPSAIETVDDTIVGLAKKDVIWHQVAHLVEAEGEAPVAAVNLVEFESDDPKIVDEKVAGLTAILKAQVGQPGETSGFTVASDEADIAALWNLRKKGVGLLGNSAGLRRPVPFVEDTAVPPEKLADYIRDFRALLDSHGLKYGMFGHVDVGCLHVRPALNMRDEGDEKLLSQLSDQVVALVKKYGGVLWGEHGKGYRSAYTPTFFGDELYQELRVVKAAFDPHNQLNPGKLATPAHSQDKLLSIRQPTRGSYDRQIAEPIRQKFEASVNCNGNGACFDWNPDSVMCPSSKVTKDRIHSPKGRAGILREWLRLMSEKGHDAGTSEAAGSPPPVAIFRGRADDSADFSHQVYDAMNGCLACKACATQCPIKVDIPEMRADFYEQYHTRYRRPLRDYFVAGLEKVLVVMGLFPRVANFFTSLKPSQWFLSHAIGIVDTPLLAPKTLVQGLKKRQASSFNLRALASLSESEKARTVIVLQDAFTTFYEPNIALAAYDSLSRLGKRVVFLPFRENGKALHVKGFVQAFHRVAERNTEFFADVAKLGIAMIGLEPAVTLTYRQEYRHALGTDAPQLQIQLFQEYLKSVLPEVLVSEPQLASLLAPRSETSPEKYRLFGHCTERTSEPQAESDWVEVFASLGKPLQIEKIGCCGMCGVFGHEKGHVEESAGIFRMSWQPRLKKESAPAVVTGHSCRSQIKRYEGYLTQHPIEVINDALRVQP